jgi:hypothetical protein
MAAKSARLPLAQGTRRGGNRPGGTGQGRPWNLAGRADNCKWRPEQNGAPASQMAAQGTDADSGGESQDMSEVSCNCESTPLSACRNSFPHKPLRECMGIEPTQHSPENSKNPAPGGAKSGALDLTKPAIDPALATLIDAWPTLPEAIRAGILALMRAAGGSGSQDGARRRPRGAPTMPRGAPAR